MYLILYKFRILKANYTFKERKGKMEMEIEFKERKEKALQLQYHVLREINYECDINQYNLLQ